MLNPRNSGRLVQAVQDLSVAKELSAVQSIVRKAARELTGADGATFVLRDGEFCHYVDEDAIAPLWKGRKFPLETCISGWVMLNREHVAIEDIYRDRRIPWDAYRPTFVQSLLMVPIRSAEPIGAIGNYWSKNRRPTDDEIEILQALADTTSTAMENIQLYQSLRAHVVELERKNYELSRFAWIASHDLQEPLRQISLYAQLLAREGDTEPNPQYLDIIASRAQRLQKMIDDILAYSGLSRTFPGFDEVDAAKAFGLAKDALRLKIEETGAVITAGELPQVFADTVLLTGLFQNLLSNAMKFQPPGNAPRIEVSGRKDARESVFSIRDNGIGIEPKFHHKVFGNFERLHSQDEFKGSGIGLAACRRIMDIHGGRIWVESSLGAGATFHFAFPARP